MEYPTANQIRMTHSYLKRRKKMNSRGRWRFWSMWINPTSSVEEASLIVFGSSPQLTALKGDFNFN